MKFEKSKINTVKRGAKKAVYDKSEIYSILDETEICNIAFIYNNKPFVQPINFGRLDDKIYIHGSLKNRMTNALLETEEVCLNVMILDAMKLTRSAFHHSVNYRSVMIFGSVKELTSDKDKLQGLKTIINHFVPNRWEYCRKPNKKELKATKVLEITIKTASAKIADTPPADKKDDLNLDFWTGTIPVKKVYDFPISDEFAKNKTKIPNHILDFVKEKNK
ncbi:MAG TPA: pyridoxamine 5'-phosphate oxidase family protein [Oceanospirillales bacterium]|nr:pyridoxamine 5'-phosphate oxidase family protein [Oceanospirillales bacterium]